MAKAVKNRAGSMVGISTTGIAGPGGGSAEKPVGLVYTAIVTDNSENVYKLNLSGDRSSVRKQTVDFMINKLYEMLNF
jgi:nicotinamide-nucleotide amidase